MARVKHNMTRWSGLYEVTAACECGKQWDSRNALAVAKVHADSTGHVVHVDQSTGITYAPAGMPKEEVMSRKRYYDDD